MGSLGQEGNSNGGFVWTELESQLKSWRPACCTSHPSRHYRSAGHAQGDLLRGRSKSPHHLRADLTGNSRTSISSSTTAKFPSATTTDHEQAQVNLYWPLTQEPLRHRLMGHTISVLIVFLAIYFNTAIHGNKARPTQPHQAPR